MNVFITSDTHFGHQGIVEFVNHDTGLKVRPWDTVEEMNEALIQNWNEVVHPEDKVYHLGDVCWKKHLMDSIFPRLNGEKILIKGNHDKFKANEYLKYFKDLRGSSIVGNKLLLTHIPVHPAELGTRFRANVHGHLHERVVLTDQGLPDRRYLCVSLEQTHFHPISLEEVELCLSLS